MLFDATDSSALFPTEIGRYFSPHGGLPFDDLICVAVVFEPMFRPLNQIEDRGIGCSTSQERFALLFLYPTDGVATVGIDG